MVLPEFVFLFVFNSTLLVTPPPPVHIPGLVKGAVVLGLGGSAVIHSPCLHFTAPNPASVLGDNCCTCLHYLRVP